MKNKLFLTIGLVLILSITGLSKIYDLSNFNGNALIKANFEALSSSEDDKQYPKYINDTEIRSDHEFKIEYDHKTGANIEYKRSCTVVVTYCKHTDEKDDICYGELNGLATTCGQWSVASM